MRIGRQHWHRYPGEPIGVGLILLGIAFSGFAVLVLAFSQPY